MFKDTEKELARLQEALLEEEEPEQQEETEEFQNYANNYGAEEETEPEVQYRGRGTTVRLTVLAILLLLGILGIAGYWAALFSGMIR